MHAAQPLAKSPLVSSYSSKKCLAKISVGYFTKWFTNYFYCWWVMYPFNFPFSAPARCWVPFRLSKHRLSSSLSQYQSISQAELSKPTREDSKISKRKRTRSLSEYIPIQGWAIILLGGHFEKAAFSGGPYLFMREANLDL